MRPSLDGWRQYHQNKHRKKKWKYIEKNNHVGIFIWYGVGGLCLFMKLGSPLSQKELQGENNDFHEITEGEDVLQAQSNLIGLGKACALIAWVLHGCYMTDILTWKAFPIQYLTLKNRNLG